MSTWTKDSSSPDTIFSTSAFFSKTSASNPRQDNSGDDALRSAVAIFPEFFCSCDICYKNVHHHEKMTRTLKPAVTENIPRDIKGWYKCEFGMK